MTDRENRINELAEKVTRPSSRDVLTKAGFRSGFFVKSSDLIMPRSRRRRARQQSGAGVRDRSAA